MYNLVFFVMGALLSDTVKQIINQVLPYIINLIK